MRPGDASELAFGLNFATFIHHLRNQKACLLSLTFASAMLDTLRFEPMATNVMRTNVAWHPDNHD